jgi:hypothetical protein
MERDDFAAEQHRPVSAFPDIPSNILSNMENPVGLRYTNYVARDGCSNQFMVWIWAVNIDFALPEKCSRDDPFVRRKAFVPG